MKSLLANKRILLSAATLLLVAGVTAGGTIAFYNDTETSSGNILTAGALDLTVDHTYAEYNGEVCGECENDISSDDQTVVSENNDAPAVPLTFVHPAWTASIPGATWIWEADGPVDPGNDEYMTFVRTFSWSGTASGATLDIASDNSHEAYLNGVLVGADASEDNFRSTTQDSYDVLSALQVGQNELKIVVKNWAGNSDPTRNPAGLMYRLSIDGECDAYAYATPGGFCELWAAQDLDGQTFFTFNDVKPADLGVNVISLHADNNDAHACLIVDGEDTENTIYEPESDYGDTSDPEGELSNYLEIFAWEDVNQNGQYEPGSGETSLYEGSIQTEIIQLMLTGGGPTSYVGFAWCAGDISADGTTGEISCDGSFMQNDAQSDAFTATLTAYAEQSRNNPDFNCAEVDLNPSDDQVDDSNLPT